MITTWWALKLSKKLKISNSLEFCFLDEAVLNSKQSSKGLVSCGVWKEEKHFKKGCFCILYLSHVLEHFAPATSPHLTWVVLQCDQLEKENLRNIVLKLSSGSQIKIPRCSFFKKFILTCERLHHSWNKVLPLFLLVPWQWVILFWYSYSD